jgi:hypothetical protein
MPREEYRDSYLSRLREWYRDLTTPEHVEKASRREVWKRQAWMIGSLTICLLGAYAVNNAIVTVFDPEPSWQLIAVLAVPIIAAIYIDMEYVFPWGVERFDLVPPWQFRDEEAKADG